VEALREQLPAWDDLVESHPLRGPDWLLTWWTTYQRPHQCLNVVLVHAGEQLIGVAPLFRQSTPWGQRLKFLGSGDACTDHTTLFAPSGREHLVGRAVGEHLLSEPDWHQLHLESVDAPDVALQVLIDTLNAQGACVHRLVQPQCWNIALPESWEDYLGTLTKSRRKRCRRLHRAYFESQRVEVVTATSENFAHVWQTFLKLHAKRWGSQQRPWGVFTDRKFRAFHEQVSQSLLARNQLRLCYLLCDGQPLAAEYQFHDQHTLYAYQSGMDLEVDRQPGNLSLLATIQFAIHHGLEHVDLLRGDEPYKAHWRAQPSSCEELRIWPSGWAGQIAWGAHQTRATASHWLRTGNWLPQSSDESTGN